MAYLSSNPPITDIRVISVQGRMEQLLRGATFVLVLNGEIQTQIAGHTTYFLNQYALLMIEPCVSFALSGRGSNLVMLVEMDYDFFAQSQSARRMGQIVCNSVEDTGKDYAILRQMLSYLALNYFEESDGKELRLLELSYSLLNVLSTAFFVKQETSEDAGSDLEARGRHIIAYVESNYMNEIQLEDLSNAVFLSPSYLSRLFKKLTGTNFKAYLEDVRLRHAAEELRSTDKTITAIAYSNGFPNVSALSTAIRKKFDMAPNEYRLYLQEQKVGAPKAPAYQEIAYQSVAEELKSLTGIEPPKALGKFQYPISNEYTVEDVTKCREIEPIWRWMINLGNAAELTELSVKRQLELVQNEIGFRYGRIENVLDDEATPAAPGGSYNFTTIFRTLEMLQSMKLTPFLDLSFSGDSLLSARAKGLYRGDTPRGQSSEQLYREKVAALVRSCINTFGAKVVEQWCVEICVLHDENMQPIEKAPEYCRRFIATYREIKALLPNMKIGGPEHHIARATGYLAEALEIFRREDIHPDFFSICAIPYEPTQLEGNSVSHIISPDPDYIRRSVLAIRYAVRECFGPDMPIYVTAMGPDIRTRNFVNDSCYQSVFFAKNTVDLIGLADGIGYWQFSDLCSDYHDTPRLFFGGTGILNKYGLKKPGFAALKRMARLETQLIAKESGMLLTTNGINAYTMLLYNYSHFNNLYCLSNGEGTVMENVYTVFNTPATKDVAIHLKGLKPGRYRVVITTINREHGSIFDEWMRYGLLDYPQLYDIQYLRDITHPHRAVSFSDCPEGSLDITVQMAPHEVKLLLILLTV